MESNENFEDSESRFVQTNERKIKFDDNKKKSTKVFLIKTQNEQDDINEQENNLQSKFENNEEDDEENNENEESEDNVSSQDLDMLETSFLEAKLRKVSNKEDQLLKSSEKLLESLEKY